MSSKMDAIFQKQLVEFNASYRDLAEKSRHSDLSDQRSEDIQSLITQANALVQRIASTNSEYYKQIKTIMDRKMLEGNRLRMIAGVVAALSRDFTLGYTKSLSEMIRGDVFSDYIEMAEYLLKENYKDPAAVIAGSTLEVHLRNLCDSYGINTTVDSTRGKNPKKATVMNSDLSKANAYDKNTQKQIEAWLGIRNSAAHGKYSEYTSETVKLFLQGLRHFIEKHPA